MAAVAKQVGGRALSYLSVQRGRPPASYGSGHSTTKRYACRTSSEVCEEVIDRLLLYPVATLALALGCAGIAIVVWANARHRNAFRSDVPRSVREQTNPRGHAPLSVDFGDHFTLAGRRWRSLAVGASPSVLLVALGGLGLKHGTGETYLRTFALLAIPIWAVIGTLGLRVRSALRADRETVAVQGADGRFRAPVGMAPVAEFGPRRLRLCECCGYPTVEPEDASRTCALCDWAADLDADAPSLEEARRNFMQHRTIYGVTYPDWRGRPLLESENATRALTIARFEAARNTVAGFNNPELWHA